MNKSNRISALAFLAILVSAWAVDANPTFAYRAFARGSHGAAGAYASSAQYGARAGARFLGPNQGGGIRGGEYAGPNGASLNTGGVFGYKKGVGAFHNSGWNGQTSSGATGAGYTKNQYNAQTGQGVRSSSEQVNSATGQNYGYSGNTNYAKGQGAQSVVQTDNKGTYDVDWQKGAKPIVTPVPASTN